MADQIKALSTSKKEETPAKKSEAKNEAPEELTEEDLKRAREEYLRAWPLEAIETR